LYRDRTQDDDSKKKWSPREPENTAIWFDRRQHSRATEETQSGCKKTQASSHSEIGDGVQWLRQVSAETPEAQQESQY
jgi:hypothetical protein